MTEAVELMTVRDVARALKLSTRQIWKLTQAEKLPAPLRLSRSVRWRAAELARFIEAGADIARFNEGAVR